MTIAETRDSNHIDRRGLIIRRGAAVRAAATDDRHIMVGCQAARQISDKLAGGSNVRPKKLIYDKYFQGAKTSGAREPEGRRHVYLQLLLPNVLEKSLRPSEP